LRYETRKKRTRRTERTYDPKYNKIILLGNDEWEWMSLGLALDPSFPGPINKRK